MSDFDKSSPFTDQKNITVGRARVIYAPALQAGFKVTHSEGWVLPSGRRTDNFAEAHASAVVMDRLMGA